MRAARQFAQRLQRDGVLGQVARLRAELFGSLGATGKGHGSDVAVLLGLLGHAPDQIDPDHVPGLIEQIRAQRRLSLLGLQPLPFDEASDLILHKRKSLPYHPNGMIFFMRWRPMARCSRNVPSIPSVVALWWMRPPWPPVQSARCHQLAPCLQKRRRVAGAVPAIRFEH